MEIKLIKTTNHAENRHTRHLCVDGRFIDLVEYFDSELHGAERFRLFEDNSEIVGAEKDETIARCLSHLDSLREFYN